MQERTAQTGLRVVRLQARSREAISTTVEHLTLHYQVGRTAVALRQRLGLQWVWAHCGSTAVAAWFAVGAVALR